MKLKFKQLTTVNCVSIYAAGKTPKIKMKRWGRAVSIVCVARSKFAF